MKVAILCATRPEENISGCGLITIQCEVPLYVWTELLTHRLFARNASSARAMSTTRYAGMGHYTPDWFYAQGKGMASSDALVDHQWLLKLLWRANWNINLLFAKAFEKLGVCKEQRNRLIPPYKYARGIVTGTEGAWQSFLRIRNHYAADKAMQRFALMVKNEIRAIDWRYAKDHIPLLPYDAESQTVNEIKKIAAARIARVSYARDKGKNDLELAESLLRDGHMSPFEHIAEWVYNPTLCAFNVKVIDRDKLLGWESYRCQLEVST